MLDGKLLLRPVGRAHLGEMLAFYACYFLLSLMEVGYRFTLIGLWKSSIILPWYSRVLFFWSARKREAKTTASNSGIPRQKRDAARK